MFASDKIDDSFKYIVWFGRKVPPKKRPGMRRVGGFSKDDEDSATGPQLVSIGNAKKLITKIE
jgi:hypothetical protein